nr:aspartyl protease family protein At5g10770-like isoform X2 [Quercus suber]POE91488.1 aspartyl protease family protein [Quercus suber]
MTEILEQDQSRVNSIHTRLSKKLGLNGLRASKATTIPAKSGSTIGSSNYVVTIGLGTPKRDLTLIFDTGSDITWTQCQPCLKCYQQKEPTFDPSKSSTYSNISCSSSVCSQLSSATGNSPRCSSSTCVYRIQYGDKSFSVGFFGKEKLTLTPSDVFKNFLFGCGENNQGLFSGAAGLLGLGRNPLSLIQQTATKYNRVFSYCLPSTSSATGHLTFGKTASSSSAIKFTPFSKLTENTSFYGLNTLGITVGGKKLSIATSVFSNAGTVIDSGTVITRLPHDAYSALKAAFKAKMKSYPLTSGFSLLDTCYDLSKYKTVSIPKISFLFSGNVKVDLDVSGIILAQKISQVCLAFAGNSDNDSVGIFGNVQQRRLEVVYDVAGGRVGFGPAGCT